METVDHGARYLAMGAADPNPAARPRPEVVDFIRDELPYLNFDAFYDWSQRALLLMNRHEIAYAGCQDRYFLLTVLLKRHDALHPWVYDRCREVEAEPDGYLDLWARYHYKSTIITFAGIIQEILRDPEITVGIFAGTRKIAVPFLQQIKRELESNDFLKRFYADVLFDDPAKQSPMWSDEGIVVRRQSNPKEATVEAFGLVQGSPTGRHFRLLVYDDLVDNDLVSNPDMVAKVTTSWELSDNLGVGEGTRKWHVGTRYSYNDTYGVLIQRQSVKQRLYPATHNGELDGEPVFLSREKWAEVIRDQRTTVAAQMLQNPTAGKENTFRGEWLRSYEVRPATVNLYMMIDPSKGRSATSDRTAIALLAIDAQGNKFLVDGYCHRMTLSERWQAVRDLYLKWHQRPGIALFKVGWEQYGLAVDLEYVREQQQIKGPVFHIEELNWARDSISQSKKDRVERLEPDVRNSRFWLPAVVWSKQHGAECTWEVKGNAIIYKPVTGQSNAVRTMFEIGQQHRVARPLKRQDENREVYDLTVTLIEEMQLFPFAVHDDLVDACSRIYDLEPRPANPREDRTVREMNDAISA